MAQAREAKQKLKDDMDMKDSYELMLHLGMVEMVHEVDLLDRRARKAREAKKPAQKSEGKQ